MNKGLRLLYCKECGRRRFHSKIVMADFRSKWTCSKGHSWIAAKFSLDTITNVMKEQLTPERLKGLFERDDTFYRELRKR